MSQIFFKSKFRRPRVGWAVGSLVLGASSLTAFIPARAASIPKAGFGAPAIHDAEELNELAATADDQGHVYLLYPDKSAALCRDCSSALMLLLSADNGAHWESPRPLTPHANGQEQAQIAVDSADRRTVYAAWLQGARGELVVAKSTDYGQSWSVVIADRGFEDASHPVIAARGSDVYVAFERGGQLWLASSHNGGIEFTVDGIAPAAHTHAPEPGAVAIGPDGSPLVAWTGHTGSSPDGIKIYVSRYEDAWKTVLMDTSAVAASVSGSFQPQPRISLAADGAGVLYALWSAIGRTTGARSAVQRVFFAQSTTGGATWSLKEGVSSAPAGVRQVLPLVAAGSAGNVRIAWIDSRESPEWHTYLRSSTNGGATWSAETRVGSAASTGRSGYTAPGN